MNYIFMTLSIAGGILLAMVTMLFIMLQPCIIKWYSKQTMKMLDSMMDTTTKDESE